MFSLKELALKQKANLILLCLFAIFTGASLIAQAYLLVTIINDIFLKGISFSKIIPLLVGLLFALSTRTFFQFLSGRIGIKLASSVKNEIRKSLLQTYSTTTIQSSITDQSGQKVSVIVDAVDKLDDYFSKYIPQMTQCLVIPIMIFITIFFEHVPTAIVIFITAPFIPIFMIVIGLKTKDKSEHQLKQLAAFSGEFLDSLQGLTTLKIFGQAKKQKEEIEKSSLDFRDATMDVLKIAFQNTFTLEFVSMLSIGLIALEVALRMIIFQDLDFFTGFLMLVLAPEFYNKLKELGSAFHSGKGSIGAAQVIKGELEKKMEPIPWGDEQMESTPPSITLNGAVFQYDESEFRLKPIIMNINPNENIAIVGKTGSGKTTLLQILAGLLPLGEGEILVNGKSRDTYSEKDWFSSLSYISQSPYLFSGTIAENIAIGSNQSVTQEEIEEAASQAGIEEMVNTLAQGYQTMVGEGGRGLSGGEKQRIALARAFLKKPSLILFDEPTTGLDLFTEEIIQKSIKELSKNATVVTVAHRLRTIQNKDKIYVMEKGGIIAAGTHQELMHHQVYRNMVSLQQGGA